jgi:penicillin-binding protein-related factor A (putative recombinase)
LSDGKEFEKDFEDSCKKTSFHYMRLVDSAKWVQGQGSTFTPTNVCDCILHASPFAFLLELKSTKGAGISFNAGDPTQKPQGAKTQVMIKAKQVKDLLKASLHHGVIAGLIFNFRERELKTKSEPNEVFFVHIQDFVKFATETGKSSINRADCMDIGILMLCEQKKVHYRYDIELFVQEAIPKYIQSGHISRPQILQMHEWVARVLEATANG